MIAKVYSCIGPLYIKIAEERTDDVDTILNKWKYACLIEIFDDEEKELLITFKYS